MLIRALVVWLGFVVLAVANGALRQAVLAPRMSDAAAHASSSVTLSAAILVVAWLTIRWIGPHSRRAAWTIGVLWLALTVAFEFLAGHYLFGTPWSELLAAYDVRGGQLWMLVLVTTLIAPVVAASRLPGPSARSSGSRRSGAAGL
jgi:hypothetical protein